jgi:hypothetical protein
MGFTLRNDNANGQEITSPAMRQSRIRRHGCLPGTPNGIQFALLEYCLN